MGFYSRKIFIETLGVEFMGLSSTLSSLLGFLNLAELGVGQAVAVVLYKPLFDKNRYELTKIISVLGFIYSVIGLFILIVGIGVSIFLPIIYPNTQFSWDVIYLGFYSYLFSSLLGYFVNYKQNVLWADQKGYQVTGFFQIIGLVKTIIQILLATYYRDFIIYFVIEILFSLVYAFVLHWRVKVTYPWLHTSILQGRKKYKDYPRIFKLTGQLFIHKMSGFAQFQIIPLLIYGYVALPMVTLYTNYTSVANQVKSFLGGILDSTNAGVGNLIAEGNKENIFSVYKELLCLRYFLSGGIACCMYFLSSGFISLWLGRQYILSDIVVFLIVLQTFFNMARGVNEQFLNGYGLFYDVWAPIVETILLLVASMFFGSIYGLEGVLLGPTLSLFLIVNIWKPYFLFSKGMKISVWKYWSLICCYVVNMFLAYFCSKYFLDIVGLDTIGSWMSWVLTAAVYSVVVFVVYFALLYVSRREMRTLSRRMIKQVISKK